MTAGYTAPSAQDGSYPRPQLLREKWQPLDGTWQFRVDPTSMGIQEGWYHGEWAESENIVVPYPPESAMSGLERTVGNETIWYRTPFSTSSSTDANSEDISKKRTILNFGAVDYRCDVWVNGQHQGHHRGGSVPFSFDITEAIRDDGDGVIVVRVTDDALDLSMPRGKQDWVEVPHAVWYGRTSGIWQSVWLEQVAAVHITKLAWGCRCMTEGATLTATLSAAAPKGTNLSVKLRKGEVELATTSVNVVGYAVDLVIPIAEMQNGQGWEEFAWSPESPTLLDAKVTLDVPGQDPDQVASYLGLRTVQIDAGWISINGRPIYLRSVLEQGFWPDSHLSAPSTESLRHEVELVTRLGFNSVRVHQKIEDPRYLMWADRFGVLVWAEMPAAYEFSADAVERTTQEWIQRIRRDISHPSIVTWVPMNESWGTPELTRHEDQRAYLVALTNLTRALDPSRPVVSNDGWEHMDTDVVSIHDYAATGQEIVERYGSNNALEQAFAGLAGSGRRVFVGETSFSGQPIMITEFGGVKLSSDWEDKSDSWGYSEIQNPKDFAKKLLELVEGVRACPGVTGFCYTQLTDTGQEQNGLLYDDRTPKIPVEEIRAAITASIGRWG